MTNDVCGRLSVCVNVKEIPGEPYHCQRIDSNFRCFTSADTEQLSSPDKFILILMKVRLQSLINSMKLISVAF